MYKKKTWPYISIITPNYNGGRYIEKTIKSVINQSSKNFEYLVFDACSNDNSLKIIRKYKKKIDYISIKKDKGTYHAIDMAIKKSKGKVIIWINSDDILDKNAVLNVIKIFRSDKKLEWITGINGYIKKNIIFSGIPYYYPSYIIKNSLAHHNYWGFIQQESIAFKKELFIKSKGFKKNYNIAGDFHLWKNFSKYSELKSYFIKIGYFRSWYGQSSKLRMSEYFKDTGRNKIFWSLRVFRFLISLIFLPYIYLKTQYILNKYTKLK